MFGLSLIRYGSFSVRTNFRSIILGVSSGRISVRSVGVIRVGSLLLGLGLPQVFCRSGTYTKRSC